MNSHIVASALVLTVYIWVSKIWINACSSAPTSNNIHSSTSNGIISLSETWTRSIPSSIINRRGTTLSKYVIASVSSIIDSVSSSVVYYVTSSVTYTISTNVESTISSIADSTILTTKWIVS